ncbi:TonB family protein [Roseibium denhamense]|uniref:Protein TonB n=1 Tax=Roseibium denhamense TaxID=76305 RepID=A0ABY1P5K8_9HYPH|nr:TonB family protein [Roseibium denhamense]MTI07153.1 TonB family protein [Roseibium denhamense]SMP26831.1 protein TonB [Roseibium denhamense]
MTRRGRVWTIALLASAALHAGAVAVSLSAKPKLELGGAGAYEAPTLGSSPFNTVVAGTLAATVTPAVDVPISEPAADASVVSAKRVQSAPLTTARPVSPAVPATAAVSTQSSTALPLSSRGTPLLSAKQAQNTPEQFLKAASPVPSNLAKPAPVETAPHLPPETPEDEPREKEADPVREQDRQLDESVAEPAAAVEISSKSQQIAPEPADAVEETTALPADAPLPRTKPAPPKRTVTTQPDRSVQEQPKAAAKTRSGAGGQSNQTAQKGGSQRKGKSDTAGNAAVSNYPGKVYRQLLRAVRAPRSGRPPRRDAQVRFTVNAAGAVSGIRLFQSSGSTAFDKAVQAAVRSAAPFPAIPPAANRSTWTFTLPVGQ